jgi:acetyl esterase/lipase
MAMHAFRGVPEGAKDLRVDLLEWTGRELTQLPPTLMITAERDPLRNQGWQFFGQLQAAGVPSSDLYVEGVMHEFFGASAVLDRAEEAQRAAADHFVRMFGADRSVVGATPSGSTR